MSEDIDDLWNEANQAEGKICFVFETSPPAIKEMYKSTCIMMGYSHYDTFEIAKAALMHKLKQKWDAAKIREAEAMQAVAVALLLQPKVEVKI